MNEFLTSNSASMRLARTIIQAIIGVIVAYADVLVGKVVFDPDMRPVVVALVMAILSPIMATLGGDESDE